MERFGDFFPGNPQNLDELLEQMAAVDGGHAGAAQLDDARAAGPAAGPLRAAARGHGPALAGRPARRATCSTLFPQHGLGPAATNFSGQDPLRLRRDAGAARARSATSTSSRTCCAARPSPGALAEVDIDRARELLGDDAARSPRPAGRAGQDARGRRAHRAARRAGSSSRPRASARIGHNALADLFTQAGQGPASAGTSSSAPASATSARYDTKPYEFGDPFNLNIERTVRNAIRRTGARHAGAALARRLRGRAHRDAHPVVAPC